MTNIEKIENSKPLHEAMYRLWTDSVPRNITVSFMENGVLRSYTYGNLKKLNSNLEDTIKSELSKVIHVDAIQGDDTNSGSLSSPKKTLHGAINSVSRGTRLFIDLETDAELLDSVILPSSTIIDLNGHTLTLGKLKDAEGSFALRSYRHNALLSFINGNILINQPSTLSGSTYYNPIRSWNSKLHVVIHNSTVYLKKGVLIGQHSSGETSAHLSGNVTIKKSSNYDGGKLLDPSGRYMPVQLSGTITLEDGLTWDSIVNGTKAQDISTGVQIYK